jgi:hypothetical protein
MFEIMTRGYSRRVCMNQFAEDMEIDIFSEAPVVFEEERFVVEDRMADVNMHALSLWLAVGMAVATAVLLIFCTVRNWGKLVRAFHPKDKPPVPNWDEIPKPRSGGFVNLKKKDMTTHQFEVLHGYAQREHGAAIPGKKSYNHFVPTSKLMYSYPAPKVNWAPDDPRLPVNLAQDYVDGRTFEDRREHVRSALQKAATKPGMHSIESPFIKPDLFKASGVLKDEDGGEMFLPGQTASSFNKSSSPRASSPKSQLALNPDTTASSFGMHSGVGLS